MVTVSIALNPYQVALIKGLQSGKIDLEKDSLRTIAKKCGDKKIQPQMAKHHIQQLVKMGIVQIIRGEYVYLKENK